MSVISHNREKSILETLSRLRFLAGIRSGEKIDIPSLTASAGGIVSRIYRMFSSQSRHTTYDFISETFESADTLIKECEANKESKLYSVPYRTMLVEEMINAKDGCSNLLTTYSSDRMYVSKLGTLLNSVEMKLASLTPLPKSESPIETNDSAMNRTEGT